MQAVKNVYEVKLYPFKEDMPVRTVHVIASELNEAIKKATSSEYQVLGAQFVARIDIE